jgi:site-specific DNA-methyltransferase (adenine-specific)
MEYKIIEQESNVLMEPLIAYIAENKVSRSIIPVYKTTDTALYHDDCLEIMSRFPDNYVDMIFADPPYNLSNGGVTCYACKIVSVNKVKWDKSEGFEKDLDFHETWISECRRILK